MTLQDIEEKVARGGSVTRQEAEFLAAYPDLDALCDAADRLRRKYVGDKVDSCSIVNARSGMCGEDCKWCAQSMRYHTGCETYNFVDAEEVMQAARRNEQEGIQRLSLVTSGRAVSDKDMPAFCEVYRRLADETSLYLCASMGLLSKEKLAMLKEAGVKRYHCNMETSESVFSRLCTTHTPEDKKATIRAAKELGMTVCSGGIIGMGETMAERLDFAFELAALDVDSVPINVLNPIAGTPLEHQTPITEEDVIRTVALFRFILPAKSLRFAGGRIRLSKKSMLRIMNGGMNGALMGDMLTTIGNQISEDRELFREAGMQF